ncbi:FixH family protein [Bacillus sp. FJAT-47783]|uniref:FixH family protein n=1 Tax=Bacillus sp. FJAT-47783 TaxID=2922712 RepID=UPI001FABA6E7|nr:FixH family protein [Bacillus sp. FJAT-47783]
MKRYTFGIIFILAIILSGCNSEQTIEVKINKPLVFQKDKASPFEVKITDGEKPLSDMKATAGFSMKNMDHGHHEITLSEKEEGIYTGSIELPMEGEWEIFISVEKDGKVTEKIIEYDVKKREGVALINGEWITEKDLEFYRFINKLHIAISRSQDEETYKGKALEEALAYWDTQEKLNEDQNQLITQIIRLRSMAFLAIEKGHQVTEEEVKEEVKKVQSQYNQFDVAKKMIHEYGDQKFWDKQQKQYELIVLSQKVQQDLVEKVKKENPNVNEQEIYYLAEKQYEELLVSQVNSLDIEIF